MSFKQWEDKTYMEGLMLRHLLSAKRSKYLIVVTVLKQLAFKATCSIKLLLYFPLINTTVPLDACPSNFTHLARVFLKFSV